MFRRMKAPDLNLLELHVVANGHNVVASRTHEGRPSDSPTKALMKCLESKQLSSCHVLDSAHNVQGFHPEVESLLLHL